MLCRLQAPRARAARAASAASCSWASFSTGPLLLVKSNVLHLYLLCFHHSHVRYRTLSKVAAGNTKGHIINIGEESVKLDAVRMNVIN